MNQRKIEKITGYIFLKSNPQKADIALVFGTRHLEVVNEVYKLYRAGLMPKILISGGENRITGKNESLEMNKKLIELGVNQSDIILENQSTNSLENVLFSKQVIEEKFGLNNVKKIIAVVKHYHSRRALMTLKKHFPKNIELSLATYEIYGFNAKNWYTSKIGKEKVIGEWDKISKYLAKGDIEEI